MKPVQHSGLHYSIGLILLLLLLPFAAPPLEKTTGCQNLFGSSNPAELVPLSKMGAAADCLPWRIDWWEDAAREMLLAGDAQGAVRYYETALQEAQQIGRQTGFELSVSAKMDFASALQLEGKYSQALEILDQVIMRTGYSSQILFKMVELHLAQGSYAAATRALQTLTDIQPENSDAQSKLGILLSVQDPEKALPHLKKAVELNPEFESTAAGLREAVLSSRIAGDPAYTLLNTGRALAAINEWELAAEAFHQSVQLRPDFAEAWAFLGEARQHIPPLNDPSNSSRSQSDGLVELQTAIELDSQSLAAQMLMAFYWIRQSQYSQALEALHKAEMLAPDNPMLISTLAEIQAASGNLPLAYETYQKAASLAPFDLTYQRQIVRFSLDYHYQIESIAAPLAAQLLDEAPDDPVNLDLIAQVLIMRGDLPGAQRYLWQALKIDPALASGHLHMGVVYLLSGDVSSAQKSLDLARELDPIGSIGKQAQRLLNNSRP